jgi:hypothetical protein
LVPVKAYAWHFNLFLFSCAVISAFSAYSGVRSCVPDVESGTSSTAPSSVESSLFLLADSIAASTAF